MNSAQAQFPVFIARWIANSFGLWAASELLESVTLSDSLAVILLTGLVLSVVNALVKPVVIALSLPAILLSFGVFTVFINGLMVLLVDWFMDSFDAGGYGSAVLAGIIIGLVNYVVTRLTDKRNVGKT